MDGVVFYSHRAPFVELKNHLSDVAERAKRLYREQKEFIKLPIDEDFINTIAISHDFGKYTSFFQDYIVKGIKDNKNRHHHGFISALFGAWLSKKKDYLPLVAYFVIKHHHGDLKNFDDDLDDRKNLDNFLILEDQIEDLKKNQKYIEKEYGFSISEFLNNYRHVWKELQRLKFGLFESDTKEKRIEIYFTILYTYSLLIDSDKKVAARVGESERKELSEDLLERYRKIKGWDNPNDETNKLRNELYYEVRRKIQNLESIPDISTITAPTGLGKTFLNLEVALRYRSKLEQKPRIIYSLPFISIIDQTYKVYDEVLSKTLGEEYLRNKSLYLLKHHHLAGTEYRKDNEEKPVNESLLLIESWNSEIIITTFVQFLHSVIAFKNSFIKKFHNIAGSIIILDEIQAIDVGLWKAIGLVLKKLAELLGCKIILSTATKPLIVEEFTELVENQKKYFCSPVLRRTKLIPKTEEKKTIEEFAQYFIEDLDENLKSYLVVLNTIKSSIEFFEMIKHLTEKGYQVYYLSTNIIPLQRKVRIRKIKNALEKKEKAIVVSTQVIEAGIDLDFQKIYRDLAPLDSIIQVAGRCNRNNKLSLGLVEIHRLYNPDIGKEYSKMIYGSTSINKTQEILKNEYTENFYRDLSDKYFQELKKCKSFEKSELVMKDIEKLWFHKKDKCIAKDFKVIEELPTYQDLFIEINETAKRIYKVFCRDVLGEKDFLKRLENYQKLKKNFKKYIISVPQKLLNYSENSQIFPKISLGNINDFYDKKGYGFKLSRKEDFLIW